MSSPVRSARTRSQRLQQDFEAGVDRLRGFDAPRQAAGPGWQLRAFALVHMVHQMGDLRFSGWIGMFTGGRIWLLTHGLP